MKKLHISLITCICIVLLVVVYFVTYRKDTNVEKIIPTEVATATITMPLMTHATSTEKMYKYIEVVDSCGPYYTDSDCVNMRSGPGKTFPTVERLRNGVVLRVADTVTDAEGKEWYKIAIDKNIRFPERVTSDWYVAAEVVRLIYDNGNEVYKMGTSPTTPKRIVVDLSEEMLYAYDGYDLYMQEPISTGLQYTPTPLGDFIAFRKIPSRYMQGPLDGVSDQSFDLPGVPWNLYFTEDGSVIHGAYWHDRFGQPWSHGCVNLHPENAKKLYQWADIGTTVTVQE